MPINRALLTMLILLCPLPGHAESLIQLAPGILIEPIKSMEISEIWHSTSPQSVAATNATVVVRMFDVENQPERDNLVGCGWILIGSGDIGSRPVGFRIWREQRDCHIKVSKKVTVTIDGAEQFRFSIGASRSYLITVDTASKVFIEKRQIGTIE